VTRVAVTGASGFIGRHVMRDLAARGDEVRAVARPFERASLADRFRRVDVVVHLAGVVSATRESEYIDANVTSTRIVAEAVRDAGVRLVHISSLAAAGPAPATAPRREEDAPAPMTAYGRSKLEGERAILAVDGLRWTILRPGVVYGPGDRALLPLFRMARGALLPLVGRATAAYTCIHVGDLVQTIAAAIDRDVSGETMFVGHATPVSARELLEEVRRAARGSATVVRVPRPILRMAASAGDVAGFLRGRPTVVNSRRYRELYASGFVSSVDRLRNCLGIVAQTGLRDGLTQTAEWYRAEGWL
jgi:nucleoside-diphosphate-sugar epimerase